MKSPFFITVKDKLSSATTGFMVKTYVGIGMLLSSASKKAEKNEEDVEAEINKRALEIKESLKQLNTEKLLQ
ncbi:MAG TPA: hypothetical protein VL098_15445 [Flavipsychrobacter sp.]|nr:hypothetical protein [Flavipsychrobacter sp.]